MSEAGIIVKRELTPKVFQTVLGALVIMPVVAIVILYFMGSFNYKELPLYGDLPEFSLVERSGQILTNNDFKGKVWVASFIFTTCTEQCPLINQAMQRIQNKLRFKENFRLVSISVDPVRDTVTSLKSYADKWNADPFKWLFLTGKENEIKELVQIGRRDYSLLKEFSIGLKKKEESFLFSLKIFYL